jgi:hypothetical protein
MAAPVRRRAVPKGFTRGNPPLPAVRTGDRGGRWDRGASTGLGLASARGPFPPPSSPLVPRGSRRPLPQTTGEGFCWARSRAKGRGRVRPPGPRAEARGYECHKPRLARSSQTGLHLLAWANPRATRRSRAAPVGVKPAAMNATSPVLLVPRKRGSPARAGRTSRTPPFARSARGGEAPPGELREPRAGLVAVPAAGFNPWWWGRFENRRSHG